MSVNNTKLTSAARCSLLRVTLSNSLFASLVACRAVPLLYRWGGGHVPLMSVGTNPVTPVLAPRERREKGIKARAAAFNLARPLLLSRSFYLFIFLF